jgi:hypothetical protein
MKPLKQTLFLGAITALLCQCGNVSPKADRLKFYAADADKDGRLSLEESIRFEHRRIFDLVDYDRDGAISLDEAKDIEPDFTLAKFNRYDLNRDGKVTFEEFDRVQRAKGNVRKRFEATDPDGDGYVTLQEADARVQFLQAQAGGAM